MSCEPDSLQRFQSYQHLKKKKNVFLYYCLLPQVLDLDLEAVRWPDIYVHSKQVLLPTSHNTTLCPAWIPVLHARTHRISFANHSRSLNPPLIWKWLFLLHWSARKLSEWTCKSSPFHSCQESIPDLTSLLSSTQVRTRNKVRKRSGKRGKESIDLDPKDMPCYYCSS